MASTDDILKGFGPVRAGELDGDETPQNPPTASFDAPVLRRGATEDYRSVPAKPRAGQRKLAEVFLRWGPERDANFKVAVERVSQRGLRGDVVLGGWCGEFLDPITERDIAANYGGGRYKVIVYGTHPKSGSAGHILEEVLVDIEGNPKPVGTVAPPPGDNRNEPGRSDMAYDRLLRDRDRFRDDMMMSRFSPRQPAPAPTYPHHGGNDSSRVLAEALRDTISATTSGKDQLIDRLERMVASGGNGSSVNHEIIQSLTAQHEAHKEAMQARYEAILTEERERHTRELERISGRAERQVEELRLTLERQLNEARTNLTDVRSNLERQLESERQTKIREISMERDNLTRSIQSERDRYDKDVSRLMQQLEDERRDHKRDVDRIEQSSQTEISRLTNSLQEELKRVRHDLEMRVESERRSKEEALALERERSKTVIDSVSENAKLQMEKVTEQAKMNTSQIERYSDAMLKVEEVKGQSMTEQLRETIRRLESDLHIARQETSRLRDRVEEKEDIPSQVGKLRMLSETLADLTGTGHDETAIVPAASEGGVLGTIKSLMDTRFGKRAGEVVGAVVGNAFNNMSRPGGPQAMPQQQQAPQAPMPQAMPQNLPPGAVVIQTPQGPQIAVPVQQRPQAPRAPQTPQRGRPVEAQIEEALYGPQQRPQAPPASQEEMSSRVKTWVASVEAAIERELPPGDIADGLISAGLPQEAVSGILDGDVTEIVSQIKDFVGTRGILESEKGVAYLRKVQEIMRGRLRAST